MRVRRISALTAATSLLAAVACSTPAAAAASSSSSSSRSINPLSAPSIQAFGQQPFAPKKFNINLDESLNNCKPTGQIDDARCDYETVEKDINTSNFFQTLSNLVKEKYFRYYKVDLYKDCPFWNENSLCMSKDCTVSKVDEFQIPVEYRTACLSSLKTTDEAEVLPQHADMSSALVKHGHDHDASAVEGGDGKTGALAAGDATCQCAETDFCHWEDEEWSPESLWVDLIDNPERFTGYEGPGAHKVWRSIYEENCFGLARPSSTFSHSAAAGNLLSGGASALQESKRAAEAFSSLLNKQSTPLDDSNEQCLEKRVFYKIISGLHASISIHICNDYLDRKTGEWKPNLQCFVERIAQHPERLQNVYFNHVVLTRALAKLAERLGMVRREGQSEGDQRRPRIDKKALSDDDVLAKLAPGLPSSPSNGLLGRLLQQSLDSPPTFDEASMFDKNNPESEFLRSEFRDKFRNVSRIMDCVGCDKCRLWGKLQVNGLGTALKILFEGSNLNPDRILQRSELVALINTVHRISESIRAVESFRDMYQVEQQKQSAAATSHQKKVVPSSASSPSARRSNGSRPIAPKSGSNQGEKAEQTLLQRVMSVLDRGRSACESQWRRCLSWCLTIFDQDNRGSSSSKQKTEL